MDFIHGSEVDFSDAFAIRPQRTFTVNSNAPINSYEVPPSGGVATFPQNRSFGDRIILWRTSGQKLYLEERALMNTVPNGSLCLDFIRTPIIPGTSITILEESILSVVVPTQSTIHRFYARLPTSKYDSSSILNCISEDDFLSKFHTSHVLQTNAKPIRASVTQHPNKNTIAYCTAEGHLSIVALTRYQDEKYEEFLLGDTGVFFKRFLGGQGSPNTFSDVVVIKNPRSSALSADLRRKTSGTHAFADIAYSVTKKGVLSAWNAETQRAYTQAIDLSQYTPFMQSNFIANRDQDADESQIEDRDENLTATFLIKSHAFGEDILLVVAAVSEDCGTYFHLVRVRGEQMDYLASYEKLAKSGKDETLHDFVITKVCEAQEVLPEDPPVNRDEDSMDADDSTDSRQETLSHPPASMEQISLTAMWQTRTAKEYILRRIIFGIDLAKGKRQTRIGWHEVGRMNKSRVEPEKENKADKNWDDELDARDGLSTAELSIEQMHDAVFNVDNYSFEVVSRAVQITCEGVRYNNIRSQNWTDLGRHVELYLQSPEFYRAFQIKNERSIRLKATAEDAAGTAKKRFWMALVKACDEMQHASRGIIALASIQIDFDVRLVAAIHKDRFTIISDVQPELYDALRGPSKVSTTDILPMPNQSLVDKIEQASLVADRKILLMRRERLERSSGNCARMDVDDVAASGEYAENVLSFDVDQSSSRQIIKLAKCFLPMANYGAKTQFLTVDGKRVENPFGAPTRCVFGGSFTQSLVGANIRDVVTKRLHFAITLHALVRRVEKCSIDDLSLELDNVVSQYREIFDQLNVITCKRESGAKMSLATWLTSDQEGLVVVRNEGATKESRTQGRRGDYNAFLDATTDNAIRALLPSSESFLLAKRLVANQQFRILKTILNEYVTLTKALCPAIRFYQGIAYSGTEFPNKAMESFAAAFDGFVEGNTAVRRAVYGLLPRAFLPDQTSGQSVLDQLTLAEFYLTVVKFLQDHNHNDEVVQVAMKAIGNLPADNESVKRISNTLFNHLTARQQWANAFRLIIKIHGKGDRLRGAICELLTLMLREGEWESVATMVYGEHEEVVEDFLRDAASRQHASEKKHFYELLSAYYIVRNDYRSAASTMYEFARFIEQSANMTAELLKKKRYVLSTVLNMMDVLTPQNDDGENDMSDVALIFPLFDEIHLKALVSDPLKAAAMAKRPFQQLAQNESDESNKGSTPITDGSYSGNHSSDYTGSDSSSSRETDSTHRKLLLLHEKMQREALEHEDDTTPSITFSDLNSDKENAEEPKQEVESPEPTTNEPWKQRRRVVIITQQKVREEWLLTSARVALVSTPSWEGIPPVDPKELLNALIELQHYDAAFDIANQFSLNTRDLLFSLTRDAIEIDALGCAGRIATASSDPNGWVRKNRRHCDMFSSNGDHWAVVRGILSAARIASPADSRSLRGTTEAFLTHELNAPCWLHVEYSKEDVNDYLRCLVDFDALTTALQVISRLVDDMTLKIVSSSSRTLLPYGVIQEAMQFSGKKLLNAKKDDDMSELERLRKEVDQKLVSYFRRIESFERALKFGQTA